MAAATGATVVFEPVNQIARARNTGAAAATGDWLIFVDADSRPSAELFADVQEAINRVQSEDVTRQTVAWARELGFRSINLDLIYGLPFQTIDTFAGIQLSSGNAVAEKDTRKSFGQHDFAPG